MTTALFIVSEGGYWAEECLTPLAELTDAGVEITVATPTGEPPVVDDRSVDPAVVGDTESEQLRERHRTDERLQDPQPIAAVAPDTFDAVVFPGGHGTQMDINHDQHAQAALRTAVSGSDGVALVICHAVGMLAFARAADGSLLVADRTVTGFPNEWETDIVDEHDRLPDGRKLPYWVEDEVVAAGGDWKSNLEQETSVVTDGDLLTARGPASSQAAARTLLERIANE